jgi:hypothetical protein
MLRSLICLLQEKPQIGAGSTAGGFVAGTTPSFFNVPVDHIIQYLQLFAFLVTIIAGILTIYATIKKNKKPDCGDENYTRC